jgi:uridylate kinase
MQGNIPILVFNLFERDNIKKAVMGMDIGTKVRSDKDE